MVERPKTREIPAIFVLRLRETHFIGPCFWGTKVFARQHRPVRRVKSGIMNLGMMGWDQFVWLVNTGNTLLPAPQDVPYIVQHVQLDKDIQQGLQPPILVHPAVPALSLMPLIINRVLTRQLSGVQQEKSSYRGG
jgi:hypothetical protein